MFDGEYSSNNYKVFKKLNIGAKIKNLEMIRLVPDRLKTKKLS